MERKLTLKKRGASTAILEELVPLDSIVTVGSDPGATILLDEKTVAPEQFLIVIEDGDVVLMNHAEGTTLNGETLELGARIALNDGALVEIGSFELFYGNIDTEDLEKPANPTVHSHLTASEPGDVSAHAVGTAPAKSAQPEAEIDFVEENKKTVMNEPDEDDRDFSRLLYDLKEEDVFYFQIKDSDSVIQRIPFKADEIWLGTKFGSVAIEHSEDNLDEVFSRINKDWSGVVVYPRDEHHLLYNGDKLLEPARLSNGDELKLIDDFEEQAYQSTVSFHEPVSVMALDSILPAEMPEPVSSGSKKSASEIVDKRGGSPGGGATVPTAENNLIFGYFTFADILILSVGTIVTAAMVFLVLELV